MLLTGYGGFNISLTPAFDPANFVLLDAGGIYAVANLRGGGEYGEAWHEAGHVRAQAERVRRLHRRRRMARRERVVDRRARSRSKAAATADCSPAAVMVQRPDLFGAVVCRVPVADMLRYHLFTVGRFWISEYGSADDPEQFPFLYQYSPLPQRARTASPTRRS